MPDTQVSIEAEIVSERRVPAGFWGLVLAQATGALTDNAYKIIILMMILQSDLEPATRRTLVALSGALFMLPFILFSAHAGPVADRFSKRTVMIRCKIAELLIMLTACAALAHGSIPLLLGILFLIQVQSAFFSPAKYGVLPQILTSSQLSWGNGVLELGTFVGIIGGTVAGGVLFSLYAGTPATAGLLLACLTVIGLVSLITIPKVPAARPDHPVPLNAFRDLFDSLRFASAQKPLLRIIIGIAYFWALGALLQLNTVDFGTEVLHGLTETEQGYLLAAVGIGVGVGCYVAGLFSERRVELGLVPLGAVAMAAATALLYPFGTSLAASCALLSGVGIAGGLYIVPLNSALQQRSPEDRKGALIAAANFVTFSAMFLSAGLYWALTVGAGFGPSKLFLLAGILTLGVGIWICTMLPEALARLVLWLLTHTFYRVDRIAPERVPDRGGALLVCNHVSFADTLFVLYGLARPVRFMMDRDYADHPLLRHIARVLRVIPISYQDGPEILKEAYRAAQDAIRQGELVCIFPEGQITRTGQMLPFKASLERIVRETGAPIIPLHLDRVWGSIFSFEGNRFLWKLPRRIPYHVTLSFGTPLPADTDAGTVRAAIQELGTHAAILRAQEVRSLAEEFVRTARTHPRRFSMVDTGTRRRLTFRESLIRATVLARALSPGWSGQDMIGICMPPSTAGALVNSAVLLAGRAPVNINYTSSRESIRSAVEQCGIRTIISSRAFLEKVPLDLPGEVRFIEDVVAASTRAQKAFAWLAAHLLPARALMGACGATRIPVPDDIATVIFSSGSTGEPKGVMLTHANIISNIQALSQIFSLGGRDVILGILPFFHSFGFTGTLGLPLVIGCGAAYHANPLDARAVGATVREYGATFLLSTPTFLQAYTRRVEPGDFGSLRYVIVGAEKLSDRVADAFVEKFGIEPYEGYGCTECSPIVAANVPDFRARGFRQIGHKRGRIGHAIPGVTIRVVDTDTGVPVPAGTSGLMLVRGPNVMKGYLGQPEKTADVIRDGWYRTGDIGVIDADGFVQITDRLSRFSKIGGEMVPHGKIEEHLHAAAGVTEMTFCVTGIPDASRGERLAVIHTAKPDTIPALIAKLSAEGLPNLWIPKVPDFVSVPEIPLLGTGKVDLRKVRELAQQAAAGA